MLGTSKRLCAVAIAILGIAAVAAFARPADATSVSSTTTTTTLAGPVRCAQPVSSGAMPTASDCLFILKAAVGIGSCVPACVCDVNGDFNGTATDALACLNIAVGVQLPLACPCSGSTTTTMASDAGACCEDGRKGRVCSIAARDLCMGTYLGDSEDSVCSSEEWALCDLPATTTTTLSTTTTLGTTTTLITPPTTTTTTTLSDRLGPCCEGGQCTIVAPDNCDGLYLGDSTAASCSRADRRACASSPTTTTTVP